MRLSAALKRSTEKCMVHVLSFFLYPRSLLWRCGELFSPLLITETLLQQRPLFQSGLWRTRLALILNLDFTLFHQDKLMQVSTPAPSPALPRGRCVFFISHFRSGEDSRNPNCVAHCLHNYSRGYNEQHQAPKSRSRCQGKQIIHSY